MSDKKVFIVSGVRTPMASFRGSFSKVSAAELGTTAVRAAMERSGLKDSEIEEIIGGCVLSAGQGQNVTRQIALACDFPASVQAVTVNKVCSSSMKALVFAAMSIKCGYRNRIVVVGTENMSQVPFYVPRGELPYGGVTLTDGIAKDGLEDAKEKVPMGVCAEKTAKETQISRAEQDEYAINSYKKAAAAWQTGKFADEVVPVTISQNGKPGIVVSEDEEFKKLNESKVGSLRTVFDKNGTITAANASSLNDGAAAAVVVSSESLPQGATPLAEVVAFAEAGLPPIDFTLAPVNAVQELLAKSNLSVGDIALWEINEAFSVTVLAFAKELGVDLGRVNVKGGAVALGHPLGMSGIRIVISLAHSLSSGQYGIAAICNGGGEATAVLLRKP
ncbi:unnamed protein product [Caenorhabditis auriculariae]|uniref:Uncharacterized protein n=1 Tax=Caenorhabditis auriculariae TaxID=2777116 RepID=A0A8S1H9W6_9PELO|nr:unnamed protein product [Caenorhabditis auriculariae]